MSPRIAALVALLALICVSAQAQNITRLLSSQYMYGGFDPSAFRPEQERKRFVFFFTPNVTAQTLDIAIAAPVASGWVACGLSPSSTANMVTPANVNTAVQGLSNNPTTPFLRLLSGRSFGDTGTTTSFTVTNFSSTVDGTYLVVRFTRTFSFTPTSTHTFLNAARSSDSNHGPHDFSEYAFTNVNLVTGAGLTAPVPCTSANCNGICEPYYCIPPPAPLTAPPPVEAPASADTCNLASFANRVELSAFFNFGYTINGSTISVGVSVPEESRWASFGIPRDSRSLLMNNAEAVIVNFGESPPTMRGFDLGTQKDTSAFTEISSDLSLVPGRACTIGGRRLWFFTRNLAGRNNAIPTAGEVGVLGIASRNALVFVNNLPSTSGHDGFAPGSNSVARRAVDFSSGAAGVDTSTVIAPIRLAHGALMFIGWGVILQFGAFWARYAKKLPKACGAPLWFVIHRFFQPIGYAITIIAFILAIVMVAQVGSPHFNTAHKALGLATTILGLIQVFIAPFRPHPPNKEKGESEPTLIRKLWEYKHWYVGRIALILAVITIFLGLQAIGAGIGFTIAYGILVGIIVLSYIIFEIVRLLDSSKERGCY